jgi:hypothetical protein
MTTTMTQRSVTSLRVRCHGIATIVGRAMMPS